MKRNKIISIIEGEDSKQMQESHIDRKMEEYAEERSIAFVKWLDGECDRSSDGNYFYYGKNKYFTIEQLYEIFSAFTAVS